MMFAGAGEVCYRRREVVTGDDYGGESNFAGGESNFRLGLVYWAGSGLGLCMVHKFYLCTITTPSLHGIITHSSFDPTN
jgi:hypothetical protein